MTRASYPRTVRFLLLCVFALATFTHAQPRASAPDFRGTYCIEDGAFLGLTVPPRARITVTEHRGMSLELETRDPSGAPVRYLYFLDATGWRRSGDRYVRTSESTDLHLFSLSQWRTDEALYKTQSGSLMYEERVSGMGLEYWLVPWSSSHVRSRRELKPSCSK